MLSNNTIRRSARPSVNWSTAGWLIAISIATAYVIQRAPDSVLSVDAVPVAIVAVLFAFLLAVALGSAVTRNQPPKVVVYRLTLLIWWVILVCEVVFDRMGDSTQSYASHFSVQAYGEGIVWVLAFVVLAILSLQQPNYLRHLFTGSYKWITLFSMVCLASVAYSPGKTYAGAWAFKLLLVILLLQFGASMLSGVADLVTLLKVTLWAFFILALVPAIEALYNYSTAFEGVGGRLNAGPDALSLTGASLLLLSVILYAIEKRKTMIFTGFLGCAVMLLSLGKTAIVAGVFSVMLFLLLQKQVARMAAVLLGIAAVAFVVLSVTPLASHLQSYEGAATLTGRTFIWTTALAAIRQNWLIGHGYLSTYFSWNRNSGLVAGFVNLHNGFLEVAYNNGVIGLAVLLMIHFAILRNLWRSIRGASRLRARAPRDRRNVQAYLLSVGSLALYANLTINGLFNTTFGGRPTSPFMLFLALFVMVDVLRRQIGERLVATAVDIKAPRADWFPVEVPARS